MTLRGSVIFSSSLVISLLCGACQTSPRPPLVEPRQTPTTRPAEFRLPDDFFPIMPWELPLRSANFAHAEHGLKSLADCGFTTAAFVPPRLVPQCRRLGLRAIVFGGDEVRRWKDLDDARIRASVKRMIDEAGRDDTVLGYFICDEPGVQEFPALAKAVAAVKEMAPGKLAYINLYPNYATIGAPSLSQLGTASYAEYLERFITEVKPQLLSYDNYRVQISKDLADPKGPVSYFTNLAQVRDAAQRHGLPFWQIVNANQVRPFAHPPSPANLLLQAYTTLAAGGEGLTYFTYYAGKYKTAPVDKDGRCTVIWSYLRMTNEQLKVVGPVMRRLRSTGVYYTSPADESLAALPGEVVENVTSSTPLMVGEFAHRSEGGRYALLVNVALDRSTEVRVKPRAERANVSQLSPVDGSFAPLLSEESFWLTPGQGVLLKFE
jgi:hypothetical protein